MRHLEGRRQSWGVFTGHRSSVFHFATRKSISTVSLVSILASHVKRPIIARMGNILAWGTFTSGSKSVRKVAKGWTTGEKRKDVARSHMAVKQHIGFLVVQISQKCWESRRKSHLKICPSIKQRLYNASPRGRKDLGDVSQSKIRGPTLWRLTRIRHHL